LAYSITDGTYGLLSNTDKKNLLSEFDINKTDYSNDMNKKTDKVLALLEKKSPNNSE